jgi:hypothetical protein
MKVTSRDFLRRFAEMKRRASAGETIVVTSANQDFLFQASPRTWQGVLKGQAQITGDIFGTGIEWEASK